MAFSGQNFGRQVKIGLNFGFKGQICYNFRFLGQNFGFKVIFVDNFGL